MSEVCLSCQQRAHGKARGAYQFRCPECCAALIRSARPMRRLQDGHIAAMERFHRRDWPAMWERIQRCLAGEGAVSAAGGGA